MKRDRYAALLVVTVTCAFLAGSWWGTRPTVDAPARHHHATGYTCPMHPSYTSDRAGTCPMCGMALVGAGDRDAVGAAGTHGVSVRRITVSTDRQQVTGVRVAEVRRSAGSRDLRLTGRVVADETRTYTVNAGIEGFVSDVSPVSTGSLVRKGQSLAVFSAPEAIPSLQAYIVAVNAMDRLKGTGGEGPAQAQISSTSSNFQQRVEKLQDMGMSVEQIDEVARTRAVPQGIRIVAPADGFVVSRTISVGQRFSRGTEWFRIADLERVWVVADVFGLDSDLINTGLHATISIPGRSRTVDARVTRILPEYDAVTRTLQVRLEVDNRGCVLRPEMGVDVHLAVARTPALTVPRDAVIDTGLRQVVYVEHQQGVFEPREIRAGWRSGDAVEIVAGLEAGERVAVSGAFLLDSESRLTLRPPQPDSSGSAVDPVCGMEVTGNDLTSDYRGHRHHFCSQECKEKFGKDPDRYLPRTVPAASQQARAGSAPTER